MSISRRLATTLSGAIILAGMPALALAHAELVSTSPTEGATLDVAPSRIVIVFDAELDPDGSDLIVTDGAGVTVGTGGVDLEVAERNSLRADVTLDGNDTYEVTWTAASVDSHAESGSYEFSVATGAAAPDTALPVGTPFVFGGLVMLALAAVLVRRVAVR
jgi:methionine-rich copper-binding protein CopC